MFALFCKTVPYPFRTTNNLLPFSILELWARSKGFWKFIFGGLCLVNETFLLRGIDNPLFYLLAYFYRLKFPINLRFCSEVLNPYNLFLLGLSSFFLSLPLPKIGFHILYFLNDPLETDGVNVTSGNTFSEQRSELNFFLLQIQRKLPKMHYF